MKRFMKTSPVPYVSMQKLSCLSLLACCLLLQGCSWFGLGGDSVDRGPTLSELEPAELPDPDIRLPKVTIEDIEESYRLALEVAETPEIRRKILTRLAGLQMARSEQNQLDATETGQFFDEAIGMYQELIDLQRPHGETDKLQYQLAKAYALDGRVEESAGVLDSIAAEYPASPLIAEAQFRRAERFFSERNYAEAEKAYAAVMAVGEASSYFQNAVYMHGWSQFKRNRYRASLKSFTLVLDQLTPADGDFSKLDGPRKNLSQDTLRVMSLVFSYLDGAQTITDVYQRLGVRPYHHQLYDRLGQLYLNKRRYRDSANTYKHFVDHYPNSDHSPGFAVRTIEVYERGNFPSLILPSKETFVKNYGIHSQYWAQKDEKVRDELRTYLHIYLPELARYYHAEAQDYNTVKGDKNLTKKLADAKLTLAQLNEKQRNTYLTAARWYEEFVATFPADKQTPEMVFLMAESLNEAGEWPKAVDAYERVAYEYIDKKHGAEAGYSAILVAEKLIQSTVQPNQQTWVVRKTNSALNFADYYATDKRAPAVLAQASQSLLEQGLHEKAVAAAKRVTSWQPAVSSDLLHTAWLVQGHGLFDLKQYTAAESAYRSVLKLISPKDKERAVIEERIAASIFKHAEQLLAANDKAQAIEQLLRVRTVTPESDIAIKAQYDAANYLMELKRWEEAEKELTDFRRRFSGHKLTPSIPAKLAVIYQEMENWDLAAATLEEIYRANPSEDVKKQSLYLAAELYEKSGNRQKAIVTYRRYANTYQQPFDIVIEAQYKLTELYQHEKQLSKRNFWLRKLMTSHAKAGNSKSERSTYLAAFASSELAEQKYKQFRAIRLTLPLKRSLKKKKQALTGTLQAYKKTLDYGVAKFTTQASFRIGEVYARLSKDLMDSQRPKNLDALALEQYEILLEEQAFPFEEKAIEIHEANAQRSWEGIYDDWVKESFQSLSTLLPARYRKTEKLIEYSETIY